MHMILLVVIGPAWNSSIRASLGISSLAFHGLVICDDSYLHTSPVSFDDLVGKVVVGERKDTKINGSLSH